MSALGTLLHAAYVAGNLRQEASQRGQGLHQAPHLLEELQEGWPFHRGEVWGLVDSPLLPEITQAGDHAPAGQARVARKFSVAQVSKPIQWSDWRLGEWGLCWGKMG